MFVSLNPTWLGISLARAVVFQPAECLTLRVGRQHWLCPHCLIMKGVLSDNSAEGETHGAEMVFVVALPRVYLLLVIIL